MAQAEPSSPWEQSSESVALGDQHERVMLVAGQTFCLSDRSGEILPTAPHGFFVGDTRAISRVHLTVDGEAVESLAVAQDGGWAATFVGRSSAAPGASLLVIRRRTLQPGLAEQIELRNHHAHPRSTTVRLELGADFADLFSVKDGRARPQGRRSVQVHQPHLRLSWVLGEIRRESMVTTESDGTGTLQVDQDGLTWVVEVPARTSVTARWSVAVALGAEWLGRSLGPLTEDSSRARQTSWIDAAATIDTDDSALARAYRRSLSDISSLRLFDPTGVRRPVVAAGAPWFMTLFGRDSLWTSYMTLPVDPTLALGVLEALAELQGDDINFRTEEEPGRIMHETRFEGANTLALEGGTTYYGSVDATPLFVVVLGELARWGLPPEHLARLLPHADRALAWIEDFGDRDGDGYVEYLRANPKGLANQGWKDSWDAIRHRDGTIASAPIALGEVQAYVYAAYRARAELALSSGDHERAARFERKAASLKHAFNRDFWIDELGWFAMGLDRAKRPIGALASNMGHCLWAGIVDDDRAIAVAERLGSADLWTGWGLRTMAASEVAYDPTSYHCGTVWPHDSAIAIAGVAAHGPPELAFRLVEGLLDAADRSDGRLPELFLGLARDDVPAPVPYPTSCSPQAWSAASPLLLLRALLGLAPDVPRGQMVVRPSLPPTTDTLDVRGLRLWDCRFDVRWHRGSLEVSGLPAHVQLAPAS
ncbi:MAG TPA: glycogen debranching N-terminal domain-containing protein [Acidimicrobiales bacterium]|nr:glycogen debranching N-terminal domain-containing protein [Acidimicrobiales bacterium]